MKQISNPSSVGGAGPSFENLVQATFLLLMLTGSKVPCFPGCQIEKIQSQGRYKGIHTDDIIIYTKNAISGEERKLYGQIKLSVSFTRRNKQFVETLEAAWADFKDSKFRKNKDAIVILTGPISAENIAHVRPILEMARYSENFQDLRSKIQSDKKNKKLGIFREIIEHSSSDQISNADLFEFLRHFHVWCFDLDTPYGINLSLIHSVIGVYYEKKPHLMWSHIVQEVVNFNKYAGVFTRDNISEEILDVFKKPPTSVIPTTYISSTGKEQLKWFGPSQYAADLAVMSLVGSFDECNRFDNEFISQISQKDFEKWRESIREVLHIDSTSLHYRNGIWRVKDRSILLNSLNSRIYDSHIKSFKDSAVDVLTYIDNSAQPYNLFAFGVNDGYSIQLEKSIGNTLALLGTHSNELSNCAESTVLNAIREIIINSLLNADISIWRKLDYMLPDIAEADPDTYLEVLWSVIHQPKNPIVKLYSFKDGWISGDHMTGFFTALEVLAWSPDYLYRVCDIMVKFPYMGVNNKPTGRTVNFLTAIFLPWFPQTVVDVKFRKIIFLNLKDEHPELIWEIILRIIPRIGQTGIPHNEPKWRDYIPENWSNTVSKKDYSEFVSFSIGIMIDLAQDDLERTIDIIQNLNRVPQNSLEEVINFLSRQSQHFNSDESNRIIWQLLTDFVNNQKRYPEAKVALDSFSLNKLEEIISKTAPKKPLHRYARLFTLKESNLYTRDGDWEEQHLELENARYEAVKEILKDGGYNSIIELSEIVEAPQIIGNALGRIISSQLDEFLIPSFLGTKNYRYASLVQGYIWKSFYEKGWKWVDHFDKKEWTLIQVAIFLGYLPFGHKTWSRADKWLGKNVKEYWERTLVNPYHTDDDLTPAIKALTKYGRANIALECVYRGLSIKEGIDAKLIVWVLLESLNEVQSRQNHVEEYHIEKIIKHVQQDTEIDPAKIAKVEWGYLSLLSRSRIVTPIYLETELASNPQFFHSVLLAAQTPGSAHDMIESEEKQKLLDNIAQNNLLLFNWRIVPGSKRNGSFSGQDFIEWFEEVKKLCEESGLLDQAYSQLGEVLVYSPKDPDGLWIHHKVAETLNAEDAGYMRAAYCTKKYNSRGVHSVDPTGAPELELAAKFVKQAKDLENHGYFRFAQELKKLSGTYKEEAKSIRNRKY